MIGIANVFPKLQTVKILVRALSKNHHFRKRFDSQHVKVSQILAKSPWERFYHVFWSFWEKLIWKISPVLLGEILPIFLTHWLPRVRILLKIGRICHSQFKYHSLKKEKLFFKFLFHLWTLYQVLNILKKKDGRHS